MQLGATPLGLVVSDSSIRLQSERHAQDFCKPPLGEARHVHSTLPHTPAPRHNPCCTHHGMHHAHQPWRRRPLQGSQGAPHPPGPLTDTWEHWFKGGSQWRFLHCNTVYTTCPSNTCSRAVPERLAICTPGVLAQYMSGHTCWVGSRYLLRSTRACLLRAGYAMPSCPSRALALRCTTAHNIWQQQRGRRTPRCLTHNSSHQLNRKGGHNHVLTTVLQTQQSCSHNGAGGTSPAAEAWPCASQFASTGAAGLGVGA
jgi:hypothetical protein